MGGGSCWVVDVRRQMAIQVTFRPMRLSSLHLRGAYEMVVPVIERELRHNARDPMHVVQARAEQHVRRRRRNC